MLNRTQTVLFSCILINLCSIGAAQELPSKSCEYDRARLLALDENQFDQDLSGGWRALAAAPGCALAAADLLRDYREVHRQESGTFYWHEGQMRAKAGQNPEAIALMKRSYHPANLDKTGWNPYVDATIAFLSQDREAFEQAKARLAAVEPLVADGMSPVVNGHVELDLADGSKMKVRWPINIDVVERLGDCFGKSYAEAYVDGCPQGGH